MAIVYSLHCSMEGKGFPVDAQWIFFLSSFEMRDISLSLSLSLSYSGRTAKRGTILLIKAFNFMIWETFLPLYLMRVFIF